MTLSDSGRRFTSKTRLRHGITRADRLLGNGKLQGERRTFYATLCRVLLAPVAEPTILVDWSDLTADQSVHLSLNGQTENMVRPHFMGFLDADMPDLYSSWV
ncbi:hypothetical protein [uncultured Thiohalocapsa sp.]|uniref:hypothetical protein n=1 Tax=uncultured Thiohalocapsa sp. TaxID=768990 RepID=UPI0025EAD1F6|nr:hypothetical protein [uncultured Thiohalocapsa sp.]